MGDAIKRIYSERRRTIERNRVNPCVMQFDVLCWIAGGARNHPAFAFQGRCETSCDKAGSETQKMRHNRNRGIIIGDKLDADCTG